MSAPLVGKPIDRVDGRLKVTGGAKYSAEWPSRGMLHAVMVTSTVAKGRIIDVATAEAERVPGVVRVFTYKNAPKLNAEPKTQNDRVLFVLQDNVIRYDRTPIALVVADTLERATEAASKVTFRYEVTGEVKLFDHFAPSPQPGTPLPHDEPTDVHKGDAESALASAAVRLDHVYSTPAEHHNPMEPHATIAEWDGDHLTLYDATQGIFGARMRVAYVLGVPAGNVRVITKFLGGGFGCKGSTWTHTVLAAMAARELKRPVKLVLTRPQMFSSVGFRPPTSQRLALGAAHDGKLVALIHQSRSATSTFDSFLEPAAVLSRVLYASPNITSTHELVRVDTATPTYMRAPGESSGSFALESAMDELAVALGIDPIALRIRNEAKVDPVSGKPFSSRSILECYRVAAERFGWSRRNPKPRSMRQGNVLVGLGMAASTYPTNRSASSANARILSDGSGYVTAGTQDLGTGAYTIFTQLSAQSLGLPVERVRFDLGDTSYPMAPVSGGSQTTASVGSAIAAAGANAVQKLVALAVADAQSPLAGRSPDQIGAADGRVFLKGDPSHGETYAAVLERAGMPQIDAAGDAKPASPDDEKYSLHAFGAQFAEVHVDADYGMIHVERMVSAFASGRIVNAKTAMSQYIGGMTFGIGMALFEESRYDDRLGRIMNADLADYLVPTHADVPTLEAIIVPEDDVNVNPIGVKGIGEIGIVGGAAAIANAVYNATGVRIRDLPITPDKVLV